MLNGRLSISPRRISLPQLLVRRRAGYRIVRLADGRKAAPFYYARELALLIAAALLAAAVTIVIGTRDRK